MKFWELRASANKPNADLLIYGEIVGGEKWDETDVSIADFNAEISALSSSVKELNMRINSPGGSVFTTIAMMNSLKRLKSEKNVTINAYIDGIGASSASMLPMVADNIYMYSNAFLMIHKPMVVAQFANSVTLRESADWLDMTETNTFVPAYKSKGTQALTDERVNELLNGKDNWLSASEASELFNITVVEEAINMAACAEFDVNGIFKGAPEAIKQLFASQKPQVNKLTDEERQNILADSKASLTYMKTLNLI